MRKMIVRPPITGLPIIGAAAAQILGPNKRRIGLIINNYGTQNIYLYSTEELIAAGTGFTIYPGFGLAMMQDGTCPQSVIYAGQAAAGGILNIIEIQDDDRMAL